MIIKIFPQKKLIKFPQQHENAFPAFWLIVSPQKPSSNTQEEKPFNKNHTKKHFIAKEEIKISMNWVIYQVLSNQLRIELKKRRNETFVIQVEHKKIIFFDNFFLMDGKSNVIF